MKKLSIGNAVVLALVLLGVFVGAFFSIGSFSVIERPILLPRYFTGECTPIDGVDNRLQQISSHTNEPTWYHCDSSESNTWIPDNEQCEYTIQGAGVVYVCDGITNNKNDLGTNKCKKIKGNFDGDAQTPVVVNAKDTIYVNTNVVFSTGKVSVRYPAYGIKFTSPDGFIRSTTSNCVANSIDNDLHTLDRGSRTIIQPNVPLNVVIGLQRASSSQVVSISSINGGDPIYITRPGYYYKIQEAEDGFEYVDTTGREFSNTKIECIPKTTGCSDDATIIPLVDQSCNAFGGAITDYAPVQGDQSKLCKYSCSGGKLSLTSDCVDTKECPTNKPIWNPETGNCQGVIDPLPEDQEEIVFTPQLLMIILGFVAIILIMIAIKLRMK